MTDTIRLSLGIVSADHDPREFQGHPDIPELVVLPGNSGEFKVDGSFPEPGKAIQLAKRIQRLPLLEAFYLNYGNFEVDAAEATRRNSVFGRDIGWVMLAIKEKEERDNPKHW